MRDHGEVIRKAEKALLIFKELGEAATEWHNARMAVCEMTVTDSGYREALNRLSNAEDWLSRFVASLK